MTSERIIPSPDGWDVAESRHGPTDTVILSELFQQNVQISYFCITYSPSLSLFVVSSLHAGGRIPSIAQWTCSVCGRTLYFIWKSLHWWILNQTQNIRNASPFVLGIFILPFTLTGYDTFLIDHPLKDQVVFPHFLTLCIKMHLRYTKLSTCNNERAK